MKKMVALALAIAMMVSLVSVASAQKLWFHTSVSCTDTTSYYDVDNLHIYKVYTCDDNSIYVYHFDDVDKDQYTNHFRGRKSGTPNSNFSNVGAKWCTQYLEVPIQSNSIVVNKYYGVSARGNTNYYNYDGVKSVMLNGYYDPNKGYTGNEDDY